MSRFKEITSNPEFMADFNDGMLYRLLAEKYGVGDSTVRGWVAKGWLKIDGTKRSAVRICCKCGEKFSIDITENGNSFRGRPKYCSKVCRINDNKFKQGEVAGSYFSRIYG